MSGETSAARSVSWSEANQRVLAAEFARLKAQLARESLARASNALDQERAALPSPAAIDELSSAFALSAFERDLLLLCAGVEMDAELAARCAAGGELPGRPYATFALALARLEDPHWSALTPVGPLRLWRLLDVTDEHALTTSRLRLDERVLHYLAGINYLDPRLRPLLHTRPAPAAMADSHAAIVESIVRLAKAAVARQARVQLEMGGKNPLVILADADLDKAVAIAADGGFFQTGQRCTALSRVIVEGAIHDKFVAALAERAKGLKVGPALAERDASRAGFKRKPVRAEHELRRHRHRRRRPPRRRGRPAKLDTPGYFMQPTVIADTDPDMRINCEEVFGPVVSTIRAKNYAEALELANRGEFGLSAGIVSNNAKLIRDFRRNVRAGMVMVNLPTAGVDYHVPFGGTRGSSYGPREQGFAAVEFYTQIKTVYTGD